MEGKDSGREAAEDVCVFCGRNLPDGVGRFIMSDTVCCDDCHEDMKLEPHTGDGREGE